jgi:hypothetical protein
LLSSPGAGFFHFPVFEFLWIFGDDCPIQDFAPLILEKDFASVVPVKIINYLVMLLRSAFIFYQVAIPVLACIKFGLGILSPSNLIGLPAAAQNNVRIAISCSYRQQWGMVAFYKSNKFN